jgi:hypothetical protein
MFIISPCCLFAEAAEVAILLLMHPGFVVKEVVLFDGFFR